MKQGNTYSSYHHQNEYSVLIGILPTGSVAFVSKPFEGSISDNQILEDSGYCDWMEPADRSLADRGFTCHHLFAEKQAHLITPPNKQRGQEFMSTLDIAKGEAIAKARVHIGLLDLIKSLFISRAKSC